MLFRLLAYVTLAKHVKQRHFVWGPVLCAHRGSSWCRKGAPYEAVPALLLLSDIAVISLIVVWRMYRRDKAIKSLKDRLCGREHRLGRGQGLLFQSHELDEHIATE